MTAAPILITYRDAVPADEPVLAALFAAARPELVPLGPAMVTMQRHAQQSAYRARWPWLRIMP